MATNETVVIVGGTSGIGLATAQLLAGQSYRVIISGRSQETIARALAQIEGDVLGYPLDFTDPNSVEHFFAQVGTHQHLALIGSGPGAWGPFVQLQTTALQTAFEEKFYGFVRCAQAALTYLTDRGSITFTSGVAGRSALINTSGIAAVNGAIQALAFSLAKELAPRWVNVVSPGVIETPVYDWMTVADRAAFLAQMAADLPLGMVGQPKEVAPAYAFLIRSEFTTGTILDVDGGGRF